MITLSEQLQGIVRQYVSDNQPWPATARQIAGWAIGKKMWAPPQAQLIGQCAEQIARAMGHEYITDPQGRTVRAKHAARVQQNGEQKVLWNDIRNADRPFMQISFQQRRQQIVGDCSQLKADVESFNENSNPGPPIQLSLDFTADVQEREALAV